MTKAHKSVLDGVVETVVPGASLTVNNTDPKNPIINARIANQATAEAGTDNTQLMTALSVAQSIAKNSPPTDTSALALALADLQGSRLVMKGGVADPFDDESGVNLGTPNGNDSNTANLLHFDGANASTIITDVAGGTPRVWTARAGAQIRTDQSKFGGGSAFFNGTTDYIDTPDNSDLTLGTSDFTFDMWFRVNGGVGTRRFLTGQSNSGGNAASTSFFLNLTAGNFLQTIVNYNAASNNITLTGTTAVTDSNWHHAALQRQGNIFKIFLDGIEQATSTTSGVSVNDVSFNLAIGRGGEFTNDYWNGWIDEFRFSKVARWPNTSSFTPPIAAYSVSEGGSTNQIYDAALDLYRPSGVAATYATTITNNLDTDGSNLGSRQIRQRYPASLITTSGDRVILRLSPQSSGGSTVIEHLFIGHAGTDSAFESTPTRVTFSGANGITLAAGSTVVFSDEIVFNLDETKDLLISAQMTSETPAGRVNAGAAAGYIRYTKAGTGDYNIIAPTGYAAVASRIWLPIDLIRVRTSSGSLLNMTLISVPYPSNAQPNYARLVLQIDTELSIVANTDLQGQVSRDGGTTWATANLQLSSTLGNIKTYQDDAVDLSGIGAGTNIVWRARTLTNKNIPISGVVTQWR